jgi:hypothetical protein
VNSKATPQPVRNFFAALQWWQVLRVYIFTGVWAMGYLSLVRVDGSNRL